MNIKNLFLHPKKVLSSPLFWLNIANILLLILIGIYTYSLDDPPEKFPFSRQERILVVLLTASLLLLGFFYRRRGFSLVKKGLINFVLSLLVFIFAFVLSSYLGHANYKSYLETQDEVDKHQKIVCYSRGLATQINNKKISEKEARERINKELEDDELKEIAEKIIKGTMKEDDFDEESELSTVPIKYQQWTCNDNGCGYGDNNYVWTISKQNRIFGTLFATISLGAIIYITNFLFEKRKKEQL